MPLFPSIGGAGVLLVSFGIWKQQYRRIIQRPLNWGLAIFSVWLVVDSCFAVDRTAAFLGLANFLPFFIVFAALSLLFQTPAQLRQIAWCLVVPSVPVVILGFGQLFWGWTGQDSHPICLSASSTPQPSKTGGLCINSVGILGWVLASKGNPPGRMASVFMYANTLAVYLIIVFILGLGLWLTAYQELRALKAFPLKRLQAKSLLLRLGFLSVAVVGSSMALILTDSRNAWTITVLSCLAFAIYQGWRWLVVVVVGAAGSVLCAAFGPAPVQQLFRRIVPAFFWARLTDQMYPDRPQVMLRTTQWQFAWSMTQQRPWTGWGLRNFTPLYLAKMNIWLGHPHNLFLMMSAETGIPATILFCSLVGWVMAQGILLLAKWSSESRQDQLIIFSYLVAFSACTIFNTVDVTVFDIRINCQGWLLLSAICGVVYEQKAVKLSSHPPNVI